MQKILYPEREKWTRILERPENKGEDLDKVCKAVLAAKCNKYILLNAPEEKLQEICDILPGVKSPTIMPLEMKGWFSLHSVVNENKFWESIGALKAAGAEGILVVPIEKMVE